MNIGHRIRTVRQKKKLTQKKLAEMIKKEPSFVSHIERNSRNVSVKLLHQIAQALEISPIEILSMGTNEFEKCIEKMVLLDEESLKKLNDYIDFLTMTQRRGERLGGDPLRN